MTSTQRLPLKASSMQVKIKAFASHSASRQKVQPQTVFDGFSGTTRVSQAFAQTGYRVIANDIAVWSRVSVSAIC